MPDHARLSVVPMLADLLDHPEQAMDLAPPVAVAALVKVEGLAAVLRIAAAAPAHAGERPEHATVENGNGGRWLTPDEAAALASVPRRIIYGWSRKAGWKAFSRRLSRKVLRIEEAGLRRWLERSR